ncbi:MAG: PAS domain-containing protein [Aridibacter sp.]
METKTSKDKETRNTDNSWSFKDIPLPPELLESEAVLAQLADVFFSTDLLNPFQSNSKKDLPDVADTYRILVEQIPAVVFIAFFDKDFGEAYVSPQIEKTLGFTQEEWLNDPVRWYRHVHPEDKERWSSEVAQMFLTGEPLHSVYRVLAKDGRVLWFQCDVKIVRQTDGHPWFIHGTAFDITQQHHNEEALREYAERMQFLSRQLIKVQEFERTQIALELHDQIGQILTGLKLKLEMLARLPAKEARGRLDEAQVLVNELITRTREISLDLRPATLDHLGLLSALLRHFRAYTSQTQIEVNFSQSGLKGKRFKHEIETAAFRIVQEALTNIARHSGAKEAKVQIWVNEKNLTIEVEDKGKGFDVETALLDSESSGLTGMRERALLLGGNFKIESDSEKTRLTAEWKLEKNLEMTIKLGES